MGNTKNMKKREQFGWAQQWRGDTLKYQVQNGHIEPEDSRKRLKSDQTKID